jgi:hypothetical protein
MNAIFSSALLVGILVMLALYLSLSRVFDLTDFTVRKSLALFCAAIGLLTTFWLNDNPVVMGKYISEIVGAGIAVVLALLIFARKSIEKK